MKDDGLLLKQYSKIIPNTARINERGEIRRYYDPWNNDHNDDDHQTKDGGPSLGIYGCYTVYEVIRKGAELNPLGPCLGYRAVSTTSGFATPYIYSTYTEVLSRINCFAAGLHELISLLPPQPTQPQPTTNGTNQPVVNKQQSESDHLFIGIYMKNCVEWVITEHATYTMGGVTVPLYDTLGPDSVRYILEQTELSILICTRLEVPHLCTAKQSGTCTNLQYVIVVDGSTPTLYELCKKDGIQLVSYAKVEAMGVDYITRHPMKTNNNNNNSNDNNNKTSLNYGFHKPPSGHNVATLCYTSGTTGVPKGAMLTHTNLIAAASGTITGVPRMAATITDRHLSYLPLPHIFERMVQITILVAGASIAFYRGDPLLLIDDMNACQPTIFPAAPRVLNKIYDKITNGINSTGGFKKKLFDKAVSVKTNQLLRNGKLHHTFYDRILFQKIKKALGLQHIRFMISGSAPLSDNVMIFFRIMLGVPVVEGYGQTEGAAAATIANPGDVRSIGHVGGPTPTTEICLYDVPEMGYLHTDTIHDTAQKIPCRGRGEICIRGPNVFPGYYKDFENQHTMEMIDHEGWLHSGDIGLWRLDGTLQIIDRKKNLFKLAQGEYVAPEKIENILVRSKYVGQSFVYGDSYQSYLVAIIVPDEEVIKEWYHKNPDINNNQSISFQTLCQDMVLRSVIFQDIIQCSKDGLLNGFETVRSIYLSCEPFTIDNELITPTFKLKRKEAREKYNTVIEQLYKDGPMTTNNNKNNNTTNPEGLQSKL